MKKVPNEKVFLLLKSTKKVVFNVSELYYDAEQYWCWCINLQFTAVQTQVRCVEILGLMFLGQLYCLGLGKADFKEKFTLKLN